MLKRILSGVLSGIVLMTSIFMGGVDVNAQDNIGSGGNRNADGIHTYADGLIYENDFEEGIGNAEVLVTKLGAYGKDVEYGTGRTGRAVRLGEYGLKLGQKNLGTNYSVSVWVKPDGVVAINSPVIFVGYHSPENWVGISGHNTSTCKVWVKADSITHTTIDYVQQSPWEWTMLTLTGNGETFTIYQDGEKVAAKNDTAAQIAANALSGANQDVYLGVNYWDNEFVGLVDDVRIYNRVLTDAEVADMYAADIGGMLTENGEMYEEVLGAGNTSAEAVKYDLHLPSHVSGTDITWSSSDPQIVSARGFVSNGQQDKTVTLTGNLTNGRTITFTVTVKALDKTELLPVIEQAENIDTTYYTEESKAEFNAALEYARNVKSQRAVERAAERIEYAVKHLMYLEEYLDPWTALEKIAPAKALEIHKNDSKKIFPISGQLAGMVDVEYSSSDPKIVSYAGGTIKGLKEGKAVVTAKVTAKYDGWTMSYPTVVTVKQAPKADLSGVKATVAKNVLEKGKTAKITVKYPSNLGIKVEYTSSGSVTVTNKGVIKGAKTGNGKVVVTFTAADGTKATRTINMKVGDISGKSSVKAGKKLNLKVTGISGKATWSVNKKSLGSISQKGVLTAKKKGTITVKAKIQGITLQKKITIKK